ncbi:hypothetical protein D6764_04775 [Candidatus Woesearchaeota archaeon]|nr:MAG: hypothetical protein D6764_04775 [Candidatus Woesearchaeota archaeon]
MGRAYWQRGAITGFLFASIIVAVQFAIVLANEARLESKGMGHACTSGTACSFIQATGSYGKAFFIMAIGLGMLAGLLGAFIGFLVDRTTARF